MIKLFVISDVVLDPIKEIGKSFPNEFEILFNYSEDIIATILSFPKDELIKYDVIFIHSDQIFHRKEQEWQKSLCNVIENFSNKFNKTILLSNSFSQSFASSPQKHSFGYHSDLISTYSAEFSKLLEHSNIYIFDFLSISNRIGLDNLYDYNFGHLYQMPYSMVGVKLIAQSLMEQLKWLFSEEKKAIIVDCDNTLWKGIIGEDGVEGIVCDKNAEGIVCYNLQLFLKGKQKEGFLLCVCSKNNETDVKEVFDNKQFPLKWTDFTSRKINWDDKVINIRNIAHDLNIGTDSLIFIDDNLFELNSVSELLNGVTCFHFTANYNDFLSMTNSFFFKRRQILDADREKAKQYETEELRKSEEAKYENLDDFIKSLNIKMDIRLNDLKDIERLAQMTAKTNQFNFNKHACTPDELMEFINNKNKIYSLKVSDKYGDYGTVGLISIEIEGNNAIVDNYLMSCRALGKGIEEKFYTQILGELAKDNLQLKEIRFIKSEKNSPAQQFLEQRKQEV
jgi:FkbH-like protein